MNVVFDQSVDSFVAYPDLKMQVPWFVKSLIGV